MMLKFKGNFPSSFCPAQYSILLSPYISTPGPIQHPLLDSYFFLVPAILWTFPPSSSLLAPSQSPCCLFSSWFSLGTQDSGLDISPQSLHECESTICHLYAHGFQAKFICLNYLLAVRRLAQAITGRRRKRIKESNQVHITCHIRHTLHDCIIYLVWW